MTHYQTLGVAEDATAEDIKKAYRRLASQHHPDKGGDNAKFQEIQVAYATLSDARKRQQYDMERQGLGGQNIHFQWHHGGAGDIHEIFRQFGFGGDPFAGFRAQQQQQPRRNKDMRIEIQISLASTLEPQTKTVSVQTTDGLRTNLEVQIPRGVTNGTTIKYAGLGDNMFKTLPRGDLYAHIAVHGAPGYIANGIDLYTQTNVNCLLAITGGEVTVIGIDGKMFAINLPQGTQPGTKFRIPGQGLYQMNSEARGDLYVEMALTVPQDLSPEQIEIVRSLINTQ